MLTVHLQGVPNHKGRAKLGAARMFLTYPPSKRAKLS